LFLSQGVPMLVAGDELGRTQDGNNNVYCQDNELAWIDWTRVDEALFEYTAGLIALRRRHPVFRRRRFFQGDDVSGGGDHDIAWFRPDGSEMTDEDWHKGYAKSVAVFLNGMGITTPGPQGERVVDDTFLVLFNGHHGRLHFTLPSPEWGERWDRVLDTNESSPPGARRWSSGDRVRAEARSVLLLRRLDRAPVRRAIHGGS
jgi:isoamylase